jgi:hypothetical protein
LCIKLATIQFHYKMYGPYNIKFVYAYSSISRKITNDTLRSSRVPRSRGWETMFLILTIRTYVTSDYYVFTYIVTGTLLHYDPNHLRESKTQQTKVTFIAVKFKHKTVQESVKRNGIRYVFGRFKGTIQIPIPIPLMPF